MIAFLWRRLFWFAITLFCVVAVSFTLMRSVRGGPFDSERNMPPEVEENIKRAYHLDWSLPKQFLQYTGPFNLDDQGMLGTGERWFGGILTGDLGPSFKYRDFTVNDIVAQSLPISIALGSVALGLALIFGLSLGVASALRPGTRTDLSLRLLVTLGIAVPNFVIASVLIVVFVFQIPLLPASGWGSLRYLILPAIALGAPFAAYIARLTRTGMLEVLGADFIRTARAKGVPRKWIVLRHALKGGVLPVVTYLGPATAGILTGSLVIERIFNIPGTGSHFVNSALNRDYTLAMGVTILYTVLVYSLNMLVDIAYTLLDPRIRLEDQ